MAISNKMGSCPPTAERGAMSAGVTGTTFALAANFTNATSGSAYAMRFISPISQTNSVLTIYAFLTAKTGSPTAIKAAVFAGPSGVMDAQRPDTGAALATSGAVDVSAQTDSTWTTFSISSISLTAGVTYWLVIFNDTATPASNNATYMTRGWNGNLGSARFPAYTTTDGFTTDPTVVSAGSEAMIVIKFSDGSLLGNPFAVTTAHASNTNDRGNRYVFDATTIVDGVYLGINGLLNANLTEIKVYQGATEVASVTLDLSGKTNLGSLYFDAPVTFASGIAYDVVGKFSGNVAASNRIDGGVSPPSDVVNCMPAGIKYVDGATPGSYTAVDGMTSIFLLISNITSTGSVSTNIIKPQQRSLPDIKIW